MAKITINDILASFASTTSINARFQQVEDELNNKVLYRNNPVGEPNSMSNDLDMNGNNIMNAIIHNTSNVDAVTLNGQAPAYYLDRTNHTGVDEIADINGLQTALDAKLPLTGGTITGVTKVNYGSSPIVIVQPASAGGFPSYRIYDDTLANRAHWYYDDTTGDVVLKRNNQFSVLETSLTFEADGNVSVNGASPTAIDNLTRKDYVDTKVPYSLGCYFGSGSVPTVQEIANVATRANKFLGFDASGEMIYSAGTASVSASAVGITDSGGYYSPAVQVEDALQEVGADFTALGTTTNGEGASRIGVEDAGGHYTATDVEAALQEAGVDISANASDISTINTTLTSILKVTDLATQSWTGTDITKEFTGIPSTAKRITVMISEYSNNASSVWSMRMGLGTASTYVPTSWATVYGRIDSGGTNVDADDNSTYYLPIMRTGGSLSEITGTIVFTRQGTTNTWFGFASMIAVDTVNGDTALTSSGTWVFPAVIDRLQIVGTGTPDSGTASVMIEHY